MQRHKSGRHHHNPGDRQRFLYNMVRIIAGTLIQVGGGQIEPEQIEQILAARDREAAGPTAPAHGLTMMGIEYMEEKDIDTQGVV